MLNEDIYESMLERYETWFLVKTGAAMLVNDCSLMDC